jgi:hypothetical protein
MSHIDIIPYFFEMHMLILFISPIGNQIFFRDTERFECLITDFKDLCALHCARALCGVTLFFCGWRDSNPHAVSAAGDFKSPVSTIPPQPHDFLDWAELDLNQCRQASGFTVRPH